jgi:hypothetical protein
MSASQSKIEDGDSTSSAWTDLEGVKCEVSEAVVKKFRVEAWGRSCK